MDYVEVLTYEVGVVTSTYYLVLDGKTCREDIVDSVAVGTWLYVHVTTVAAAEEAADDSSCECTDVSVRVCLHAVPHQHWLYRHLYRLEVEVDDMWEGLLTVIE